MTLLRRTCIDAARSNLHVARQLDPFTVEMRNRKSPPRDPNHILHLCLTLLTLGAWVWIWVMVILVAWDKRRVYDRDPFYPGAWLFHVTDMGQLEQRDLGGALQQQPARAELG